jgi:hypothetical protein
MALFDAQFTNKTDRFDIANIWVETSTDNVTWTDTAASDQNKRRLVGGDVSLSGIVIPYNTPYFRIRFRATSYVYLNSLYSYFSTNGHTTSVQIFKKHDSGSWTQHTNSTAQVNSWPGHLYLPFSTIPFNPTATLGTHFHEVYVLFTPTWNGSFPSNPINISSMQWWGGYPSGRRNVYSTDEFGNVGFPAAIGTANGTAAEPAYDFTSDTNTGMYLASADTLGFATNGTAAAQFTSTGNLRLFNTAGTFYSEFSNQPTANRTITIPDGNVTLTAGTMATTTDVAAKVSSVTGTAPIVSSGGTTPAISISAATTSAAGSMSSADKTKLDGIAAGAQVNVATNIAEGTRTTTTVPITSSTGTGATLSAATTSLAGVMTSTDKTKLDGIAAGAQVNVATNIAQGTRTTTTVPITSSTGTGATLDIATTSLAGVMSSADKTKLDGIAASANNYSLPAATSTVRGGVELFSDTVQSVAANAVTTTASRTYGVQANSDGQAVVNVPWVDTTTDSTKLPLAGGTMTGAIKLDGSHTVFTTPNTGSSNTSARTVYGLAEYRSNSATQVGAIVFIAPDTTSTIMHQFEVSGLLYNQNIVNMQVQGYRTTAAWQDVRKISTGTVDVQTRWAVTPDGKNCLILGDVATSWSYPHFSIVRAMFSHNGAVDAYCSGWTVAVVTDLSTYTQLTSTIADSSMVGSITGNAATATALAAGGADRIKLDGIAANANNYVLPTASTTVTGGGRIFSDTVQSVAANAVSATASRTYGTQPNAAGQLVVNVPWTDTVYTLPAATSTALGGIEIFDNTVQTVAANTVSATASRSYGVQVNAAGQAVVNVPWVDTDVNWYPTAYSWTGGTTAGPTGSLTGAGMTAVSFGAIPSASGTASGIVTTGTQTFAGDKTFSGTITTSTADTATAATHYFVEIASDGVIRPKTLANVTTEIVTTAAVDAAGAVMNSGNESISGIKTFSNSTASTNSTTGSVVITGGLGVSGAINAGGDITAFATSDNRFKTNIENIPDALAKVSQLNGVTYNWNELANKVENKDITIREVGIIAQQVNDVLPEVVSVRDNGYMAVRYEKLVPLLIEAIKELQAKVEELEKRG